MRKSVKERFEEKFYITPGCWIWTALKNDAGYGKINIKGKMERAHRVSYEMYVGPIPDGLFLLHSCDNPACVNPAHLTPGNQKQNIHDMWQKGRASKPPPKLNKNLTPELIEIIKNSPLSQVKLSKLYGVGEATVWRIKNDKHTYLPQQKAA